MSASSPSVWFPTSRTISVHRASHVRSHFFPQGSAGTVQPLTPRKDGLVFAQNGIDGRVRLFHSRVELTAQLFVHLTGDQLTVAQSITRGDIAEWLSAEDVLRYGSDLLRKYPLADILPDLFGDPKYRSIDDGAARKLSSRILPSRNH